MTAPNTQVAQLAPGFRNQFLVTATGTDLAHLGLRSIPAAGLVVHAHPALNVEIAAKPGGTIVLLGDALDPANPATTNADLARRLLEVGEPKEHLFAALDDLTGRFVCMLLTPNEQVAVADAVGLRRIYWWSGGSRVAFSSSEKLLLCAFDLAPLTSPEKLAVISSATFAAREHAWLGDEGQDDRLRKVLPNHYLDISAGCVRRRLPVRRNPTPESEVLARSMAVLRGGYLALRNRYQLLQPLTAGLDSRVLLAASRSISDELEYYVFDRSSGRHRDASIPTALCKKLGLRFSRVEPLPLSEGFLNAFRAEHLFPRILQKTEDIQFHWLEHSSRRIVNVSTIGAEVARQFYGSGQIGVGVEMLATLAGYRSMPYFRRQVAAWMPSAEEYARALGVPLLDLFYWEQRLANWGALFPFEQDIGLEEVSLFDNRSLLLDLLSVPAPRRAPPHYPFFMSLIEQMWPEALQFPINPGENRLFAYAKRSAHVRYARSVLQSRIWRS